MAKTGKVEAHVPDQRLPEIQGFNLGFERTYPYGRPGQHLVSTLEDEQLGSLNIEVEDIDASRGLSCEPSVYRSALNFNRTRMRDGSIPQIHAFWIQDTVDCAVIQSVQRYAAV